LCGNDTLRIHTRTTWMLQKIWRQAALQRRWCPLCHWEGFARVRPQLTVPLRSAASQLPARGCRTDPLRTLRVGGNQWRVLLQTWQDRGWHYGRLLFVGPAGRLWRDPVESFAGPSRNDVVDQALSLSDGLLSYRIRELVSD
ncbi:MAG TPA: hypothetical protein VK864_21215, partial [Longimicrobiales bacterium]|nr:hypothetical protein [Longimicrobiales bacterium]